jgi:[ribosomal protein S18]-alanine N-acetyltransferase
VGEEGLPGEAGLNAHESPFRVRRAGYDDLPDLLETEGLCFSTPWSEDSFRGLLGRSEVITLVLERGSPGEAGAWPVVGHGVVVCVGPEGEVANLAVKPTASGDGGGGILLDALMAEASLRGVRTLFLEVRASNAPARALYARRGFVPVGRRPRYYEKPVEDALVLALSLP